MKKQRLPWDVFVPITDPCVAEDRYEISSVGVIRDLVTGTIVNDNVNEEGFRIVSLLSLSHKYTYDTFLVDDLVAWEWCSDDPNHDLAAIVFHIDGDYNNNCYDNLKYAHWDLDCYFEFRDIPEVSDKEEMIRRRFSEYKEDEEAIIRNHLEIKEEN